MSKETAKSKKKKKIRRLRHAHIFPSVLFFFLSLIMVVAAFAAFLAITLTGTLETRSGALMSNVDSICRVLDSAQGSEQQALDTLFADPEASDAVFVFDADGGVIASLGEATYTDRKDSLAEQVFATDLTVYADREMLEGHLDEDGDPDVTNLFIRLGVSSMLDKDNFRSGATMYEVKYWVGSDLVGGRTAMIKCTVPLLFDDLSKAFLIGLVACGMIAILMLFNLINIIFNVHNQRRMTKLLYTDTVTGGNSSMFFEERVGKRLRSNFSTTALFAIADITLEKYDNYCNFHSMKAGETLLEDVDKLLSSYMGRKEYCAHTGKASFALFLNCSDKHVGRNRVEGIIHALGAQFGRCGIVFHAGVYFSESRKSLGGKGFPERITEPSECLIRATAACATLSDESAPGVAVYDDRILEEQRWEHKVEENMQGALEREEFKVYIQPKYDPVTEKIAGAEALVRWINSDDGFVPPGRFIPIFEKNGFITKLDDYMISHVAALQAQWIAEGREVVPISVNVSRAHFADPDLARHICSLVDAYNVPHRLIEIELTESAFFDNKSVLLKIVHELNDLGFEVSMDDFGAGYSSLNSLKDLPLDVLKLDAEFFRGEDEADRGKIVVSEAISLAKKLNMRIVAEGIEKKEQVEFLAASGCDMIQGYYFAKPMPASDYANELK